MVTGFHLGRRSTNLWGSMFFMTFSANLLTDAYETVRGVTMNGPLFDVVTLGLKGLPYLPHAAFSTHRLIELLEHEPSHLILSQILATGAPILHPFEYSPSMERLAIKHQYFGCGVRDNGILDNDGWDLGFQTLQNDAPFLIPSQF